MSSTIPGPSEAFDIVQDVQLILAALLPIMSTHFVNVQDISGAPRDPPLLRAQQRMTSDTPLIASRLAISFSTPYRDSVKCAEHGMGGGGHERDGPEEVPRCVRQRGGERYCGAN
jgi:hypothetical protein